MGMRMIQISWNLILRILMFSFLFGSARGVKSAGNLSLVEGNTAFALDLYGHLKNGPGNLFFSPYSISTALAMTYAGARGDTEKQMSRVLHFDSTQGRVHSSFGELQRQLKEAEKQQGIQLNIANALWAQKGHPFLPAFLNIARGEYQANVNQADFVTGAETARGEINQWVAQQTKDKIQDILPTGSVTEATRLVLANAIYFKGVWAKQFNKDETTSQPFHLTTSRQADVPLMHHLDEVRYMENSDFQAVELPYKTGQLSMVILLPRRLDGCGDLENQLSPTLLSSSLGQMKKQKVEIFLPRFQLESRFKLNDALAVMGMPDAFGATADFSGMDAARDLYISGVFHKAWGEVNEEGTEAAAATAVTIDKLAAMQPVRPPPIFRADHPFIFFIRDTRSGSLLFVGRLADPS
jgi:serine protease inhibitor